MICYLVFDIDNEGFEDGSILGDIADEYPQYSRVFYGDGTPEKVLIEISVEAGWLDEQSWKDDVLQVIEDYAEFLEFNDANAIECEALPPQWLLDLQVSKPWFFT